MQYESSFTDQSLCTLFLFTIVTQHPSTSDKYVVLQLYEMSLSQTDEKAWLREEHFLDIWRNIVRY